MRGSGSRQRNSPGKCKSLEVASPWQVLLLALWLLSTALAQGVWVWPELESGAAGEFRRSGRSYSRPGGRLELGEVVWNGTSATPGSSCLLWRDASGQELWRRRFLLSRQWSNPGTGAVEETSYPNALVEACEPDRVIVRLSLGCWDKQSKLKAGCGVLALRLRDGQELWRASPVAMDLTPQALYGLVDGRALYEFYQQLGSDQLAVLKRGIDDGKAHWLVHVHHKLPAGRLLSARVTASGLELTCGSGSSSKRMCLNPLTGQLR